MPPSADLLARVNDCSLLLVDDDPAAIHATGQMLAHYTDLRFATSGEDALRLARERTPDLVLLDADMPGQTGLDICDALRADPQLAEVPVIFATSHDAMPLELLALQKGAVDFVSKPLVAAQFTARVRAQLRVRSLMLSLRRRYPADAPKPIARPAGRLPRVLIVDDDITAIRIIRSSLEDMGEFYFAEGGAQALALARELNPDLILVDAQMPEVDGFALCRALKAEPAFRYVPIVFVTRFADPRNEMRALDLGAVDFIAKPYVPAVLRARVRRLLKLKERADAQLEAARAHWRRAGELRACEVIDSLGDAMLSFDADEHLLVFNPAASRLFGTDREQVLGGSVRTLIPHLAVGGEGCAPARCTITRADGSQLPVELAFARCGEGRERLTTVTLRTAGLPDAAESQAPAERADEARARINTLMLSHLAQEMKDPLCSLLGHAQLMSDAKRAPLDEDQARRLEHVLAAARKLCDLRRDALDFAMFESAHSTLQTHPINTAHCVHDAMAAVAALADRAAVTLSVEVRDDAPFAFADGPRLTQCLLSLLGNAVKYNQPGGWVRVRVAREGEQIAIAVADNGLGLDAEQRMHLFEPFNRLGRQVTSVAGAGLALTIARRLVEAMNGALRVESDPGRGSCFTILLQALPDLAP